MDFNQNVSPNFKLGEFFVTGQVGGNAGLRQDFLALSERNQARIIGNIKILAADLERFVRNEFKSPIVITSGWRSVRVNRLVGGVKNSTHLDGRAADFVVRGFTPKQVQARLDRTWPGGLGFGQHFTHTDIRRPKTRFFY